MSSPNVNSKFMRPFWKTNSRLLVKQLRDKSSDITATPVNVWIQGFVESVYNDFDVIRLRDSDGCIVVRSCNHVPGGLDWLKAIADESARRQKYCQILGEAVDIYDGEVQVRAIKIVDISEDAALQKSWPNEVNEFANVLSGAIKGFR